MTTSNSGDDSNTKTKKQPRSNVVSMPEPVKYDADALAAFLDMVFHTPRQTDEHILTWAAKGRPGYPNALTDTLKVLKRTSAGRALYFGTSTCTPDPDDNVLYNRKSLFKQLHVVVLDDIGTKIDPKSLPEDLRDPTYIIETSPDNFQYGYVLNEPVSDLKQAEALIQIIYNSGYSDGGGAMPTKLVRLPGGVNGKPAADKTNFRVHLTLDDGPYWTPEKLLSAIKYEVSWADVCKDVPAVFKRKSSRTGISAWSSIVPASPNLDGAVDPILEWLYEQEMVKQELNEWVTVRCPWADMHTDGGDTAGYSPLGRGGEEYENFRNFNCFHDHCKNRSGYDFLQYIAAESGIEVPVHDPRNKMALEWAYDPVLDAGWQVTANDPLPIKMAAMRNLHPHSTKVVTREGKIKVVSDVALWTRAPNRVVIHGTTMDPTTALPLVTEGKCNYVNTFKQPEWGTPEIYDDDVAMFTEFLDYLIPDKFEREYFLDWLSAKCQSMAFRGPGILMVATMQGTGRTTLANMITTMFGRLNVADVTFDKLTGSAEFNDWQTRPLVITHETLDLGETKFYQAYERLKRLIEVQPTQALINRKFRPAQTTTVYSSYLMFSNHTNALAMSGSDRRIFVLANTMLVAPPTYFTELYKWLSELDDNGKPAWVPSIWHWLRQRTVDTDRLLAPVPTTKIKKTMLSETGGTVAKVIRMIAKHWQGDFIAYSIVFDVLNQLEHRLGIDGKASLSFLVRKGLNDISTSMHADYRCRVHGKQARPRILNSSLTADIVTAYIDNSGNIGGKKITREIERNKTSDLLRIVQDDLDVHEL